MEPLAALANLGIVPLSFLIALLLVLAKEAGFRVGTRRREAASVELSIEGAGVIVGSILALTAFVLALTLSYASTRLEERRAGALLEANAIGTAWLQAGAIGAEGASMAGLIREYATVRLDFLMAARGAPEVEAATAATNDLQTAIWAEVTAIVALRGDPVGASLMNATTTMFDATASARYAVEKGLPVAMVRLMLVMAFGAMFALGLELGLMDRPNHFLGAVLALFWAAVIVHILDMGTARIGRYEVEADPYLWMIGSMQEAPG